MKLRRHFLKVLPYAAAVGVGVLLFSLSARAEAVLQALLVNLAAAFLAIPLLLLFYQLIQGWSRKRLSHEVDEYVRMRVDTVIMSVLLQLAKIVYPNASNTSSNSVLNGLLQMPLPEIADKVVSQDHLGFHVLKHWKADLQRLETILGLPIAVARLEEDRLEILVQVVRHLTSLQALQAKTALFKSTGKKADTLGVSSGQDLGPQVEWLPDRLILVRHLSEDQCMVADFGDFPRHERERLLEYMTLDESHSKEYAGDISEILKAVAAWISLTKSEVLLNPLEFRVAPSEAPWEF